MNAARAAPVFDFRAFLAAERSRVDAALSRVIGAALRGAPESVASPVRYALEAGGKRLRPILCAAAYRAVPATRGETPPAVYELACALELIHTYSLVHDDLPCMDDDDLRRGRPTTHRVYGEPAAVVAGAALIPLAGLVLTRAGAALDLEPAVCQAVVRELAAAAGAGGMVGGQVLDLRAEGRSLRLQELEEVHRRKTGALLAASLRMGALAARASAEAVRALGEYGTAVGLAFQIADDVLDVTGKSAVLGKTAGKDRDQAKATFPSLLGVEGARLRAAAEVADGVSALRRAGLQTAELEALARYTVERDH